MENILEVENVSKEYAKFSLKNISFTIPKGMIMGLIGENGAGKTTTIKCILGMIPTYQGKIKLFGFDSQIEKEEVKEEIGVVLDEPFFPEILTPHDINTIMKDVYSTWDELLFNQYLKQFSLHSQKPIKTFSKGMKKKLEIATALSHHPKLLILDEPTSGLDPIARREIIDLFRDFIQNEECSILLSSHITTDLETLADYITFMKDGEILLTKTCDELLNQYGIVKCGEKEFQKIEKEDYLKYRKNKYEYEVLVANKDEFKKKYDMDTIDTITLESLMVLMVKGVKE